MKKNGTSPKKNFIYNLIYQMLILIIPLLTAPYLARVVGAKGVGIYSYTYSIVYYFMLLTLLGVNNYGNRSIAKARDDKEKLSKTFWSIYLLQLFMGIIMLIGYGGYILLFDNKYKLYALIEGLFIISAMLDINWFFFGMEEFKKTITRNTFIKVGNVILIFLLVKSTNDLWKYTLIMSGMALLSQLIMWGFLRKKIKFTKVSFKDIKSHIKPNLILFIPVIAISLYKMMDKIMLGSMSNVTEVGFYENAEKIINIPMTLITALGTVMLPRMSNIISKGEDKKVKEYISKSIKFVMFMSLAMCCGLIGIGREFAPIYFGESFTKTGILIIMLAGTLPFLSFANVLRTQYLIPKEKDKIYIISVSLGAITNLIMNFIFIPRLQSIGACIGTLSAEGIVMMYQAFAIRHELSIGKYFKSIIPFIIKSIIMLGCIFGIDYLKLDINPYLQLGLKVIVGGFVYCILNINYILTVLKIKKNKPKEKKKSIVYDDYTELPMIFETDSFDSDNINNYLEDLDRVKMKIRFNNSVIGLIDFNKCSDEISDVILSETKVYNFEFDNKLFLRKGKYPKQIANNYELMKYIIDQDYNNLVYVDVNNIGNDNLIDIINYAFTKVYYMKIKNSEIDFDIDNIFKNSSIIKHDYFKECYSYIDKMKGSKKK